MAVAEPLPTSHRLRAAARAELERLERHRERIELKAEALRRELATLDSARQQLDDQLLLLGRVADVDQLDRDSESNVWSHRALGRLEDEAETREVVRGRRIREVAVQVLAASSENQRPTHYGDWYGQFTAAGYAIIARDPLAVFLTQLGRSPAIKRTSKAGLYQLDWDAPERLQRRLADLHHQLREATHRSREQTDGSEDSVIALAKQIAAVERELDEATTSLGESRLPASSSIDRSYRKPQLEDAR